jgi:choline dehydrogenase-like flavoprotein
VREIVLDERGRARGAVYVDPQGREQLQPASLVVVAANGVGTPRLLLLSASSRFPDGLANSSGLVGRRLMLHPAASVLGVYEDDLESWLGPAGQPVGSLQFYETDPARGFPRGSKWDLIPGFGPQLLLWRLPVEDTWGPAIHESARRLVGRSFDWFITVEDLPDEANSVTLDAELADGDGIPAPRIDYRLSDESKAALEFNITRAIEAHEASGAVETIVSRIHADCGWHLLGTARIGCDPATSVCDPFGRTHDVANLFVVDGSVFVTAGAMNPTATICAFALRAAEHIVETARLQETPA